MGSDSVMYLLPAKNLVDVEIPEKMDVVCNKEREGYIADLALMNKRLSSPGSFVVWFLPSVLPEDVLWDSEIGSEPFRVFPDAKLYENSR